MNFKIVDGESIDYDQAKTDYINGLKGKALRKKYNLGKSAYLRLLKRFREEGIQTGYAYNRNAPFTPKNYYANTVKGHTYFIVQRVFDGEIIRFGRYKNEAEAKARVIELEKNNWEGYEK